MLMRSEDVVFIVKAEAPQGGIFGRIPCIVLLGQYRSVRVLILDQLDGRVPAIN